MDKFLKFPDGFLWGASTAAHQIEGNNVNDWSEWEKENSKKLAKEAASRYEHVRHIKIPEKFVKESENPENYISGICIDHYHHFEEDFNLAKSLGLNSLRLSIEWSRIEPEEGKFNEKEIEHYQNVIKALKERKIEPFVTLWHYTLPLWMRDKGGFLEKKNIPYYIRYVEKIVHCLKNDVKFWLTINEPELYAVESYLNGGWPPQKTSIIDYFKVTHNLIDAHKQAYILIKNIDANARVGIAKDNVCFEAYKKRLLNRILSKTVDYLWNSYFLDRIKNSQDFIGLNYYAYICINRFFIKYQGMPVSDAGWELCPSAIYNVLENLIKYHKPIYITEDGLADSTDEKRSWYIKETLKSIYKAIQSGADARGYLHWSLLDDFEWAGGFAPKFGLIEVDFKNGLKRKPRESAFEYAKIIKQNGVSITG